MKNGHDIYSESSLPPKSVVVICKEIEVVMDLQEIKVHNCLVDVCLRCKKSIQSTDTSDPVFRIHCDECFIILKEERCSDFTTETSKLLSRCDICLRSYQHLRQLKGHQCTRANVFSCNVCGYQLEEKQSIIEHKRIVHKEKYWHRFVVCYICWKRFPTISSYNIHMISHDANAQTTSAKGDRTLFECKCCNKSFNEQYSLENHLRTGPTDRPHKCCNCHKCFSTKSNLITHMRTHTGERPYRCSNCTKWFSTKPNLITHMRTHTGELPYECNKCSRCFSAKSSLISHTRTHTGEFLYKCCKCDSCDKCFNYKSQLVAHMRTHTGERPYKCGNCNKGFSTKSILVRHMRTPACGRPYKCRNCNKVFLTKPILTNFRVCPCGAIIRFKNN